MLETQSYWLNHITKWKQSGKTQTDYCREQNLSLKTFHNYKSRLSKKGADNFIELRSTSVERSNMQIELEVSGRGYRG